ncbi:MAG: hypothetical protein Q9218_006868 [Villophora microphyllina]
MAERTISEIDQRLQRVTTENQDLKQQLHTAKQELDTANQGPQPDDKPADRREQNFYTMTERRTRSRTRDKYTDHSSDPTKEETDEQSPQGPLAEERGYMPSQDVWGLGGDPTEEATDDRSPPWGRAKKRGYMPSNYIDPYKLPRRR